MGHIFFAGHSPRESSLRAFAAVAACCACMALSCFPAVAAPLSPPDSFSSPPASFSGDDAVMREAANAVRRAERSLALQTKIPGGGKTMQRENTGIDVNLPSVRLSQNMARIILYAGIAAVIIVVLVSLKDNLWSGSRSRRLVGPEQAVPAPAEAAARMEKARAEADDLALRGSFAEAMHVLLLQGVNELRNKLAISIAASLTSREILERVSLPETGKNAFAEVIGWVEISYFGFHEPTREDYASCRKSYETLTAALHQRTGKAAGREA